MPKMTKGNDEIWERLLPFECGDLVRIGSRFDGGYVHSLRTVKDSKVLLSFGIDANWDFEDDFQKLSRCDVIHAYDNCVSKWKLFSLFAQEMKKKIRGSFKTGPKKKRSVMRRLELLSGFWNFFSYPNAFFQQRISSHSSEREATLAKCMARLAPCEGKIFLKCDIEGSEYEIIEALVEFAANFSGIVIEFHGVGQFPERFMEATDKLMQKFYCIHTHINNCGGINPISGIPDLVEMSFNNISYKKEGLARSDRKYPIPRLDFPNNPLEQDISIVRDAGSECGHLDEGSVVSVHRPLSTRASS
ncbi:MAG: hypothetical protein WBX25_12750 [Rhodomicrobium sp.]